MSGSPTVFYLVKTRVQILQHSTQGFSLPFTSQPLQSELEEGTPRGARKCEHP